MNELQRLLQGKLLQEQEGMSEERGIISPKMDSIDPSNYEEQSTTNTQLDAMIPSRPEEAPTSIDHSEPVQPEVEEVAPQRELSPTEILREQLEKVRSQSKSEEEEARKNAMWSNVLQTLGTIGQAQIQRGAKTQVGITPGKMVSAQEAIAPVRSERNAQLKALMDEYKMLQGQAPKALTDLDKAKIESEKARAAKFLADAKKAERAESKESKSVYEKEEEKRNVEKYFTAKKAAENSSANDMKVDDTLDTFLNYSKGSFTGTGPIATLGGLTSYFSKDTENLDAKFKDLGLDKMVKTFAGMSKAVDSDAERRAFEKTVPSITNDDETNLQILLGAKSINLRNKIEAEAQRKYVEENGKLDSGYKSPLETTPLTTVVNPKTGEMTLVPRKDKQKYNKMGLLDLDKYSKALLDGKAQKPVSSTEIQSDKKTDPKIEDYAKKYNLDYDKAQQILRARGYNG
jgi:hypothetical protein